MQDSPTDLPPLTLKQYVYKVLSAGSTESAPVYGIFLHSAAFPEEASRMGFSDKFKEKYFLAFNPLFSLHLLNSSGSSFGHKHAVFWGTLAVLGPPDRWQQKMPSSLEWGSMGLF